MHWFEEWFDSPLYDLLYSNRNEEEAAQLATLIERIIPVSEYPNILDLGCGRGRHSLTLAERGYEVTGIDLSEEAIRVASEKADQKDLKNVRFILRDMRNPLPEQFDSVVNLFTSFGYFRSDDENIRVLESVYQMTRRGGIFFIDYMNADWVRENYKPEGEGEFRDIHYKIRRYIESDVIYKEIHFEGAALDEPKTYIEQVKLYDLEWFLETFHEIGFDVGKVFGNYEGMTYNPEHCSRLVMVVKKL
jgi:SAM-dependent methyltransferase